MWDSGIIWLVMGSLYGLVSTHCALKAHPSVKIHKLTALVFRHLDFSFFFFLFLFRDEFKMSKALNLPAETFCNFRAEESSSWSPSDRRTEVSDLWSGGRLSYHRWQVTTSVPAGPGQAADNVEHLDLELWRRGNRKYGGGVAVHASVIGPSQKEQRMQHSRVPSAPGEH